LSDAVRVAEKAASGKALAVDLSSRTAH
jgi:hypothetical protein